MCPNRLFDLRHYLNDKSVRDSITTSFRLVSDVGLGYTLLAPSRMFSIPDYSPENGCRGRSGRRLTTPESISCLTNNADVMLPPLHSSFRGAAANRRAIDLSWTLTRTLSFTHHL